MVAHYGKIRVAKSYVLQNFYSFAFTDPNIQRLLNECASVDFYSYNTYGWTYDGYAFADVDICLTIGREPLVNTRRLVPNANEIMERHGKIYAEYRKKHNIVTESSEKCHSDARKLLYDMLKELRAEIDRHIKK